MQHPHMQIYLEKQDLEKDALESHLSHLAPFLSVIPLLSSSSTNFALKPIYFASFIYTKELSFHEKLQIEYQILLTSGVNNL